MAKRKDEVIDPVKIEGSCAYCVCGERVEMPAEVVRGAGEARVRCLNCVRVLLIPTRNKRARPRAEPEPPSDEDDADD